MSVIWYFPYTLHSRASLAAQTAKHLPAVWETWVWSLGWKDPLKKGTATHSSILAMDRGAWRAIVIGLQRLEHKWIGLAPICLKWTVDLQVFCADSSKHSDVPWVSPSLTEALLPPGYCPGKGRPRTHLEIKASAAGTANTRESTHSCHTSQARPLCTRSGSRRGKQILSIHLKNCFLFLVILFLTLPRL